MLVTVVNIRRSDYDVLCTRPSVFGNPFHQHARDINIRLFEEYFYDRIEKDEVFKIEIEFLLKDRVSTLRLGCVCKPKACHADVIAAYLNDLLLRKKIRV